MENPECCEACGGEDLLACPLHGELEVVGDSPVPSLARLSLPPILALGQARDSQDCVGSGVLAAAPVQPRTRFGPLIAPLCKKPSRGSKDAVHLPDYDLSDEDRCNWMALVRPAQCQEEQNLISVSLHSQVFYVSTRMIPEGEELRVWYTPWYAQKHSLPMLPQTLAEHQHETDSMDGESGAADGMEVAVTECTEKARDQELTGNARKRSSSSSNSSSRSSPRQKKNPRFHKKNHGVNNSEGGLEKRLPLASSTVELRSRSGRKLKPNWKYPTADTNGIRSSVHALCPRKQRKGSAGAAAVKKTPLVGKADKSPSPAQHNRDVHTPIQTSLDVLISAMEHNQNEIHTKKVESIADPGEAGTEEPEAEPSPAATVKSKKSRKRQCQYCKEIFLGEEAWRTHEAGHTGEDPYVCEVEGCGKGFSSKFKHWRHQMTHRTPSSKQCPYCSKCFHRADHLKKHVQTHDVFRKLHTCERCGTGYKSKESFVYHMAVHQAQEDEALVCSLCPLQAASRQELLAHLKAVHHKYKSAVDAPKPFHCQLCDKSFTTKKDMHRHTLVHNKQRSFLCEFCAQSFRRKDHLQRHLHSNHKSLMLSAGSQNANSGFVCQLCQCSFSRKDHLTSHISSKHIHAALQEGEVTPGQADGAPGNGDLQPSAASEVLLIELKNVGPSELLGGGDWSGAPGASSVQTMPLTAVPQGWPGGLAVPVPQPSLLAGMQSQGHGATGVMEVQQQQQQQPLPKQTLVHHLQVQQQAVQQQRLQLLPVQQQPKQEQPQLLQSLLQRQQEQQQQQQQQQGQQQQQQQVRQQWQQQQGQQQQQQQQQEQLQQGQQHQKGQENLVSVTLTLPEEAFQKQGNSSLPQLQLTQPECCSPVGYAKAVFRPPRQPSDTGRQVNSGPEVNPCVNFSAVSTPQEETTQILSIDSVPKSQQHLSFAHTTSTMPAQNTSEGASGGCCADSELGQRKCMLTTLGFHTTQLKTEICDPCPIMDAVSLGNSCQMASGSCCSSDKGRPTGLPPTPVSPSVSGQLLANHAAPVTYAQNLPSSRDGASAACMFSQARGEEDSGPLDPGEWPALPTAVVGSSSLNQGGQTYIPECEVAASVSQSMSSSRLFPQAFPIRGQEGLQLNSLVPDSSASSQQRGMLAERTATSRQSDTVPETNFLRAYANDPGGEPVPGSTACPLPSNISLQDVDVAFYTSVPNGMTSIAASTTTCLVQSPLLAVGNSMPGAAGVVVSSSVYPTSSEAPPALALQTSALAAPETGTQESLNTRQLLWELSGRQGCSDHCYATTDGGIKSSEDPPPSAS